MFQPPWSGGSLTARRDTTAPHSSACRSTSMPIFCKTSLATEASVASDVLQKIGMDVDLQALEWGAVVSRRAVKEPPDHGGWNILYTQLGGVGQSSAPPPN